MTVAAKMAMARQAFDTLLSQLRDGQDEAALFTFDSTLSMNGSRLRPTSRASKAPWTSSEPFGSTSLYDATAATARRLADRSATHKAIVILTDGIDTSSTLTAPEVSGLASSIDVPVYIVATGPIDRRGTMMEGAGTMRCRQRAPTCVTWRNGQAVSWSLRATSRRPSWSPPAFSTSCASDTSSPSRPPASTNGAGSRFGSSIHRLPSRREAATSAGSVAGAFLAPSGIGADAEAV